MKYFEKRLNYSGLDVKIFPAGKWYKFAFATFKRNTDEIFEVSELLRFGNGTVENDEENIRRLKKVAEVDDVQIKIRAYKEIADILKSNETSILRQRKFFKAERYFFKAIEHYEKATSSNDDEHTIYLRLIYYFEHCGKKIFLKLLNISRSP